MKLIKKYLVTLTLIISIFSYSNCLPPKEIGEFVTDLYLITSKNNIKQPCPSDWEIVTPFQYKKEKIDLNAGAGGHFIYLCQKKQKVFTGDYFLTDIIVVSEYWEKSVQESIRETKKLGFICMENISLNKEAMGNYIYVCYKKFDPNNPKGKKLNESKGVNNIGVVVDTLENCKNKQGNYLWKFDEAGKNLKPDSRMYQCNCHDLNKGNVGQVMFLCWTVTDVKA